MLSGRNPRPTASNVGGIFFPQSKSLGIDRSTYCPSLQRKIVYAGAAHGSFAQGEQTLQELLAVRVSAKQVERLTRQVGSERVAERNAAVAAFQQLPLADKHQTPAAVTSPEVAVIEVDGGRLQIRERGARSPEAVVDEEPVVAGREKGKHWREDKAALLLTVDSKVSATDPCPEIPETFVDPTRILKLAREIHTVAAGQDGVLEPAAEGSPADEAASAEAVYKPPTLVTRQVVASRRRWPDFAPLVAQAARTAGLLGASRRAFVGDGSDNNWALQRRYFGTWTAILDFIHALSYVFAAATAGRKFAEGWPVYVRWISWLWQGQVAQGHRRTGAAAGGTRRCRAGRRRDQSAAPGGGGADVLTKPQGQDALRRVSPPGTADYQQPHGVAHETDQSAREGDREVLVRGRSRGNSATACGPAQR
jgi:hypothetical protein